MWKATFLLSSIKTGSHSPPLVSERVVQVWGEAIYKRERLQVNQHSGCFHFLQASVWPAHVPPPVGTLNAGVTGAGGLLYAAGHREIIAIPPQLAHTIKGRGGSKDSSFNQTIVWANYIWMKDPKNSPPPWAKPAQNTPNNPLGMRESARTQSTAHTNI